MSRWTGVAVGGGTPPMASMHITAQASRIHTSNVLYSSTCAIETFTLCMGCASVITSDSYMHCIRRHDLAVAARSKGRKSPTLCMYSDTRLVRSTDAPCPSCATMRRV